MSRKTFGSELRRIRAKSGKTLADLADAIDCSIVYMSDIERGRRNPPAAAKTAKLLACLDASNELSNMLQLAVRDRKSVEIELKRSGDSEMANMLAALARRADDGSLDEELALRIRRILDGEE